MLKFLYSATVPARSLSAFVVLRGGQWDIEAGRYVPAGHYEVYAPVEGAWVLQPVGQKMGDHSTYFYIHGRYRELHAAGVQVSLSKAA